MYLKSKGKKKKKETNISQLGKAPFLLFSQAPHHPRHLFSFYITSSNTRSLHQATSGTRCLVLRRQKLPSACPSFSLPLLQNSPPLTFCSFSFFPHLAVPSVASHSYLLPPTISQCPSYTHCRGAAPTPATGSATPHGGLLDLAGTSWNRLEPAGAGWGSPGLPSHSPRCRRQDTRIPYNSRRKNCNYICTQLSNNYHGYFPSRQVP